MMCYLYAIWSVFAESYYDVVEDKIPDHIVPIPIIYIMLAK
jgi:hypothetical protein